MKKYQQLAQQLTEQIALGVWLPGDRLPSLREQVISSGMSFMTVSHAYQLLESQGRIVARPQSGYYVAPQPVKLRQPAPPAQVTRDEAVDINTYIFEVLQASRQASMLPFASAFPDPRLFPLQQLNRSLAQVSKTATAMSVIENLPPGNAELRHAIARRYALQGMNVSPDEIVITARALASHISIAPGKMFSTSDSWTSFFRFNTAWGWGEREEQGVKRLGELIREQLA
ncbi:GntR family transcriptional regulator [Klebsiella pneumoniae]|uniref:GntR family transcriptional regulator n=1 Tax=Klebsiella pneumoniae TaxID=573 RepID=UPI00298D25BB|nr:GntR family transcriptional regulator [Klebsiella pneumoniae]MDW5933056.1 GntR family transcriptional regulator [Klebsiella pneumoniae]